MTSLAEEMALASANGQGPPRKTYEVKDENITIDITNKKMKNDKGQELFCQYWRRSDIENNPGPLGLVFLCHGFSEHLGLYVGIADRLAKANLLVFGNDHIGHGQSDGERVYIEDVDDYVEDQVMHCKEVQKQFPGRKLFMVAHSMGGMVALRTAIKYPKLFDGGIVYQGPLIIPGPELPFFDFRVTAIKKWTVTALMYALNWINKDLVLGKVMMDLITLDEEMKQFLQNDTKRWNGGCKLNLITAFAHCLYDNMNMMTVHESPMLILHGDADKLCNIEGSRILMSEAVNTTDKSIQEFPGAVHNLYLERPEIREVALRRTVSWILARTDFDLQRIKDSEEQQRQNERQ